MAAPDMRKPGGNPANAATTQDAAIVARTASLCKPGGEFPAYAGTREAWAYSILDALAPRLAAMGISMPPDKAVRVAVAPLSRGRLGECHPAARSVGGNINFIGLCTKQVEPAELVHTLVHEYLHACDDCQSGHRHRWHRWAQLLGMVAKGHARNQTGSDMINEALRTVGAPAQHVPSTLGAAANAAPSQVKFTCPDCGTHAYVPRKAAQSGFYVLCGYCEQPMLDVGAKSPFTLGVTS